MNPLLNPCLSYHGTVARRGHTSLVLSGGSVLVMGGENDIPGYTNDVWETLDGGASWILVTSSAGWEGKEILKLGSLSIPPPLGIECS